MVLRSSTRSGASPTSYPFSLPLRTRQRATTAPKTVHAALSSSLTAYSVFLPKPTTALDLFDVIFIESSPDLRARSPKITTTNLKRLINSRESNFLDSQIFQSFQEEFGKVDESSQDWAGLKRSMSVTESSLLTCGVGSGAYIPNNVRLGFANSRCNMREVRISDVWLQAYRGGGGGLKRLIWRHAEILLPWILAELEEELGEVGDKSLMAVTTKRIGAIVGVRNSAFRNMAIGALAGGEGAGAMFGVDASASSDEIYDNHAGICGIHFILLPVQRTEMNKWRFYRTIDVCNAEIDDYTSDPSVASRDTFYKAKTWHQVYGTAGSPTNASKDVEQYQSSSTRFLGLQEERCMENLGYVDIFRTEVKKSSIDVQIACIYSFAVLQCRLAAQYRANAGSDQRRLQQSVHLLRRALTKGSYEATVRALYDLSKSYLQSKGLPCERSTGRALKYCARALKHLYIFRRFYMTLLQDDAAMISASAPELRIVEIMSITGWPLRMSFFSSEPPYSRHEDAKYRAKRRLLALLAYTKRKTDSQHQDGQMGMNSEEIQWKDHIHNSLDWLEEETHRMGGLDNFLNWFEEETYRKGSMDNFLNCDEQEIRREGTMHSLLDSSEVGLQRRNNMYGFLSCLEKEIQGSYRIMLFKLFMLCMVPTAGLPLMLGFSVGRKLLCPPQETSRILSCLSDPAHGVRVSGWRDNHGCHIMTIACRFFAFVQNKIQRKDGEKSFFDSQKCSIERRNGRLECHSETDVVLPFLPLAPVRPPLLPLRLESSDVPQSVRSSGTTQFELRFSARGLANKDFLSLSDPFLVLHVFQDGAPSEGIGKTETVQEDINPAWTSTVSFDLTPYTANASLSIDVFSRNSSSDAKLSRHDFLGRAILRTSTLPSSPYLHVEIPLPSVNKLPLNTSQRATTRKMREHSSDSEPLQSWSSLTASTDDDEFSVPKLVAPDLNRATSPQRNMKNARRTLSIYAEKVADKDGVPIVFKVSSAMLNDATPSGRRVTQFYELQRERKTQQGREWGSVYKSEVGVTGHYTNLTFADDGYCETTVLYSLLLLLIAIVLGAKSASRYFGMRHRV